VHAARLYHRNEDAHIVQLEAAFNALDLVHGGTPDIEMDIRQSDNSITCSQRCLISFNDIGFSSVARWR
jgi:hypothetical protein